MSKPTIKSLNIYLLVAIVIAAFGATIAAQTKRGRRADQSLVKPNPASEPVVEAKIIGKEIHFADGSVVRADDVWKFDGDFWYRSGGVTQRVARSVKSVDVVRQPLEKPKGAEAGAVPDAPQPVAPDSFWVVLKGGARLKADEVTKSEEGAWCRRGSFSVLIDTERIDRIERDSDLADDAKSDSRSIRSILSVSINTEKLPRRHQAPSSLLVTSSAFRRAPPFNTTQIGRAHV